MIARILLVGMSFLGMASVGMAGQNACNYARFHVCVESATVDLSGECSSGRGGSMTDVCATSNRIGVCTVQSGTDVVYVRYFRGFPMNPEKNCEQHNGVYTPGWY